VALDARKVRGYLSLFFNPGDVGQYAAARNCPALGKEGDNTTAETFVKLGGALIITQCISNYSKGKLVGWGGIIVAFAPSKPA
jgi:hypothetical protein